MSLLEAIGQAAARSTKGPACSLGRALVTMSAQDADDLRAALASNWTGKAISVGLASIGVHVPQQTVQRHRRGECACEPR